MIPFLKLDRKIKNLTDTAAYLYFVLVYADFKKKTFGRAYLAKALGLNDLDYVTELLREIEEAGLIQRSFIYGNEYVNGHISKELRVKICPVGEWISVSLTLLNAEGTSNERGFALKLRTAAFDDSAKISMNKKDLAAYMGVSAPTLRKKMKAVEHLVKDMTFNNEYFPVYEKCYLNEKNIQFVKDVLTYVQDDKTYKQVVWFLKNKCHLRRDCNELMMKLQAGIVGLKRTEKPVFSRAEFNW